MKRGERAGRLDVLPVLPETAEYRTHRMPLIVVRPQWLALLAVAFAIVPLSMALAQAQSVPTQQSIAAGVVKWMPVMFSGFLFNLFISIAAIVVGTALGVLVGLGLVSLNRPVRSVSWTLMQFFRNAPWLVVLFYAMFLIPFSLTIAGMRVPFPDSAKAVIGLALPVMANVAEIVRGGIVSIPAGQWESAESLAFSRRQTLFQIILPQAIKRMLPPWMNLYAILVMATPLISIVGVQDGLTMTRAALVAEARPELLLPMYMTLLAMFFVYCYPIALATRALERRFDVRN